jgi:hypothetical protein
LLSKESIRHIVVVKRYAHGIAPFSGFVAHKDLLVKICLRYYFTRKCLYCQGTEGKNQGKNKKFILIFPYLSFRREKALITPRQERTPHNEYKRIAMQSMQSPIQTGESHSPKYMRQTGARRYPNTPVKIDEATA